MSARLEVESIVKPTPEDREAFADWKMMQADLHGIALAITHVEANGGDAGFVAAIIFIGNTLRAIGRRIRATADQLWRDHERSFEALSRERDRECCNQITDSDDILGEPEAD